MADSLVSLTTTGRPKYRAIKKQSAAPSIALLHDNAAPHHTPNNSPLVKVIRKAGNGAATLWSIMRSADTTGARRPYAAMYSRIACGSLKSTKMLTSQSRKEGTAKNRRRKTAAARSNILALAVLSRFTVLRALPHQYKVPPLARGSHPPH